MWGGSVWNLGSAQGPFTVKKRPLFDENALKSHLAGGRKNRGSLISVPLALRVFLWSFEGLSCDKAGPKQGRLTMEGLCFQVQYRDCSGAPCIAEPFRQ